MWIAQKFFCFQEFDYQGACQVAKNKFSIMEIHTTCRIKRVLQFSPLRKPLRFFLHKFLKVLTHFGIKNFIVNYFVRSALRSKKHTQTFSSASAFYSENSEVKSFFISLWGNSKEEEEGMRKMNFENICNKVVRQTLSGNS